MIKNCKNCSGNVYFDPKRKGNVCENCDSVFPVKYNYNFPKKPFENAYDMKVDNFAKEMKSIKCNSCGALVMVNKDEVNSYCPYCNSANILDARKKSLMYIDSIIPFNYSKSEALTILQNTVKNTAFTNKKIFKNTTKKDVNGSYINAFVFDFNTMVTYNGVFSYTVRKKDSEGNVKYETRYKNVNGTHSNVFNNITIEANTNISQGDLMQVMPYDYKNVVDFQDDFMHGYMLEYQENMFDKCFKTAEQHISGRIKNELLKKHRCDNIVKLDMKINYVDRKYNYCLLPLYLVTSNYKDKKYTTVINGQTGKVGKLPKNGLKIFLTILGACGGIVSLILLIVFLSTL